jgi:serine/threonine protein kinase
LKGFDPALNRSVAVKVLAPQLAASGAAQARFAREARAAAAVDHEHVMAIHAVDSTGRLPYLVMPLVRGESLQKRIDRIGPLQLREILRIGMQTASGLAAAHAQGLVHRDIKPANVLLEHGVERAKITDFGLARAADDASLTRTGVIAGTPQFMSPEQAAGEPIDHRADLFSLGSVLYAMCTGRPPFRAAAPIDIPSEFATSWIGSPSTPVRKKACQVASRNSSRTCLAAQRNVSLWYSRPKASSSGPPGAGSCSRSFWNAVWPVPRSGRARVRKLIIMFLAMRNSQPRKDPLDWSGSHPSIVEAIAARASCVRSSASAC